MIDKLKKIVVFVGAPIVTVIILFVWFVTCAPWYKWDKEVKDG